jgi:hypothetical protein
VLLSFSAQNAIPPGAGADPVAGGGAVDAADPGCCSSSTSGWCCRAARRARSRTPEEIDERGTVIIAGSGRFGQIVNRLLVASGVRTVVLDHEAA